MLEPGEGKRRRRLARSTAAGAGWDPESCSCTRRVGALHVRIKLQHATSPFVSSPLRSQDTFHLSLVRESSVSHSSEFSQLLTAVRGEAMATPTPQHDGHGHAPRRQPNATTIATNRWGPYSGAGDFASNMAVILAALLAALALALALNAAVRYLLRRARRRARDPEKPPVPEPDAPPPPPPLVYSAAGTKLAGPAECAICLAEFVDGDAVRVMPACGHGFHARCIERWLAGGRRSSCPTCRAPAGPRPDQPPPADS